MHCSPSFSLAHTQISYGQRCHQRERIEQQLYSKWSRLNKKKATQAQHILRAIGLPSQLPSLTPNRVIKPRSSSSKQHGPVVGRECTATNISDRAKPAFEERRINKSFTYIFYATTMLQSVTCKKAGPASVAMLDCLGSQYSCCKTSKTLRQWTSHDQPNFLRQASQACH